MNPENGRLHYVGEKNGVEKSNVTGTLGQLRGPKQLKLNFK